MAGALLPGTFSQVGRTTGIEITCLEGQLRLDDLHGDDSRSPETVAPESADADNASKGGSKSSRPKAQPRRAAREVPQSKEGELARAVQDKLRANLALVLDKDDAAAEAAVELEAQQRLYSPAKTPKLTGTYGFSSQGKEGLYATKFTASQDLGVMNRRNEVRPPPVWYRPKKEEVLVRYPAWDFGDAPRESQESDDEETAFMTGLDVTLKDPSEMTARQRAALRNQESVDDEEDEDGLIGGVMARASPRGDLGKIGRIHVIMNEVSCAGESDLLEQDIKGYPKLRYPHWDFAKSTERKPLISTEALSEPGKYDYTLDVIKPIPKGGVSFDRALPRSTCVTTMGYLAPPAVLHPEEKRSPGGCLPDRSLHKDAVRHRITNVNNFKKELSRPPLLTGGAQAYHDEKDPKACESVYMREYSYVAEVADRYATHRRDIAPGYARMLPRSRSAVQGLRALQHDLGVRGAVGLGFTETTSQHQHSVEQREARKADGARERPDVGPRFDNTSLNRHTDVSERIYRGKATVKSIKMEGKQGSRTRAGTSVRKFEREPALHGFQARVSVGKTQTLRRSRTFDAMPGWSPEVIERGLSHTLPA